MKKDAGHSRKNQDNLNHESHESMSALIITISGIFLVGFLIFSIIHLRE